MAKPKFISAMRPCGLKASRPGRLDVFLDNPVKKQVIKYTAQNSISEMFRDPIGGLVRFTFV